MLEIPPHWGSYLAQIALFLVFAGVLRVLVWNPAQAILAERARRTVGAQAEAARVREDAAATERQLAAALEAARQSGGDAGEKIRREAEAEERRLLDAAHADAVHVLADTRERLRLETEDARRTLQEQAANLSRLAAERILGRPVDA